MRKVRMIVAIFIAIVFTLFAVVQYNDPDPLVWMAIYMLIAGVSVYSIFRPLGSFITIPLMLGYFIMAIYLWPDEYYGITMPMSYRVEIELARESLGLALGGLALGVLYLVSYKSRSLSRASRF